MDDSTYWGRLLTLAKPAPRVAAALRDLKAAGAHLETDECGGLRLVCERPVPGLWLDPLAGSILALLDEVAA